MLQAAPPIPGAQLVEIVDDQQDGLRQPSEALEQALQEFIGPSR
jgi:hypothetical protein